MIKNIKEGFYKQKNMLTKTLTSLKCKLIENMKKEIGIIAFYLEEGEKKEYEKNKQLYFEIKDILLKQS